MVIIWRDDLEGHARLLYFQSVRRVYFVVQYLVLWYYTLFLILSNARLQAKIISPSVFFLFVQSRWIFHPFHAGSFGICCHGSTGGGSPFGPYTSYLGLINSDEEISLLLLWKPLCYCMGWGFGGAHLLALIVHVDLLGFLRFWGVHVCILRCYQRSGEVFAIADALEPRCFCW